MNESFSVLNNTANRLTLLRGLLVPFLAFFYLLPSAWSNQVAAIILAIAALTDYLDGVIARSYSQETKIGAYLDQAIDKVLVITALLLILFRYPIYLVFIPVLVTVLREFCVLSLRDWLQKNTSVPMSVGILGKIKTFIQFLSLILIFWVVELDNWPGRIGLFLLYLATIMTLVSAVYYVYAAAKDRTQEQEASD